MAWAGKSTWQLAPVAIAEENGGQTSVDPLASACVRSLRQQWVSSWLRRRTGFEHTGVESTQRVGCQRPPPLHFRLPAPDGW